MGGNAIKSLGIESRRIDTPELNHLTQKAQELTKDLFLWLKPVKFYHSKPDHGDIDLVGLLRPGTTISRDPTPEEKARGINPRPHWVDKLPQLCESKGLYWNAPVASFELEGVQVDISGHTNPDLAQAHLNFSHYSPTGNIVGRMIKQTGAMWGIDGLTFPIRDNLSGDGNLHGKVILSYNMKDVFDLAGLPTEKWEEGFEKQEEIFHWACQSRLFNREIFDFENLNHTNRKRDRLRPDYHAWREYITDKPERYQRYASEEARTIAKTQWFNELCNRYPHLKKERAKILEDVATRAKNRTEKFNGNLVRSWTGLQGPELGKIIKSFQNTLGKDTASFDAWLEQTTPEQAKTDFLKFYQKTKTKGPEI